MIKQVIESLPKQVSHVIIVADGYKIKEREKLKSGEVSKETASLYEEYLINLSLFCLSKRFSLIRRETREGFANNVNYGLHFVRTKFVLVCQHDIEFTQDVNLNMFLDLDIDYLTFQCRTLETISSRMAALKLPALQGFPKLCAIDFWYDKNHLVRTDYYRALFKKEVIRNFIEDSWGHTIKSRIKQDRTNFLTCRMYVYLGGNILRHLNGRKRIYA